MILLVALASGVPLGLAWSRWRGMPYPVPELRAIWMVFAAFLPQFILFYLPGFRGRTGDGFAAACLLASLVVFLGFAWLNRRVPGMSVLLVGLVLNLAVMAANGGFMPISPETASGLVSDETLAALEPGNRFGVKDILLPAAQTRLELLADRFLTPQVPGYRVAFSLGDVFIALGAFAIPVLAGATGVQPNQRGVAL